MLLGEGALGSRVFKVQALSGDIGHSGLKVVDAGVEGIGGQSWSSHASTSLQLFFAGRTPCSDSEHVSWVRRHGWCDG